MKNTVCVLLFVIVLSACAPAATPTLTLPPPTATVPPPTATPLPPTAPPPTATPTPPEPRSGFNNLLVYDIPEMYQVKIKTVEYQTLHQPAETLLMDVYYPSDWQPNTSLAAVIMANAFPGDGRNGWTAPSWARLIAANGLIGVTYDTKYADDLDAVAEHLRAHAADLGVNGDRLGVMGGSSNASLAGNFVYQPNREYVKFAVLYYGYQYTPDNFMRDQLDGWGKEYNFYSAELPDVKQLRTDLPALMVRCGRDSDFNLTTIDHFLQLAKEAGAPVTLIQFDEGSHGFDTKEVTSGSLVDQATQIIQQTLEFIKTQAFSE